MSQRVFQARGLLPDQQKTFDKVKLLFIIVQLPVTAAYQIIDALPADAFRGGDLTVARVIADNRFIYLLLALRQEFAVKIKQKRLTNDLFLIPSP